VRLLGVIPPSSPAPAHFLRSSSFNIIVWSVRPTRQTIGIWVLRAWGYSLPRWYIIHNKTVFVFLEGVQNNAILLFFVIDFFDLVSAIKVW